MEGDVDLGRGEAGLTETVSDPGPPHRASAAPPSHPAVQFARGLLDRKLGVFVDQVVTGDLAVNDVMPGTEADLVAVSITA